MNNIIDTLYDCRTDFSIVGLTGYSINGLERISEIMCRKDFYNDTSIRKPDSISCDGVEYLDPDNVSAYMKDAQKVHSAIAKMIFKRKYTICYKFIKNNYQPYSLIKYNHVLWLYSFLYFIKTKRVSTGDDLKELVSALVKDKFCPNHQDHDKDYTEFIEQHKDKFPTYFDGPNLLDDFKKWDDLYNDLTTKNICEVLNDTVENNVLQDLCGFFYKSMSFNEFLSFFDDKYQNLDYYCHYFFYHRLGMVIRNMGDPLTESIKSYKSKGNPAFLYECIRLINRLIKGIRHGKGDIHNKCRVVIDAINNSMEAVFLRERYSGFYFISIHDKISEDTTELIRERIKQCIKCYNPTTEQQTFLDEFIDLQTKKVQELKAIECRTKEYKRGKFSSPNIEQCVADAEIHIANLSFDKTQKDAYEKNMFYTLEEQWLKYASLIDHPGIITPSSDERCMAIAFSAKFNSGCISRQVGAVITNKDHSIRTIGWNDVPYGQIPCSLRELKDLVPYTDGDFKHFMYSDFEKSDIITYENSNYSFNACVKTEYSHALANLPKEMNGLPFSYCFKDLHNKYEGEKNQVHTRSLHAEENAMLQMVKYGGQPLINGIIYVTASPCELCSKKLYQIGVRRIVFIDDYPGIAKNNITNNGLKRPHLDRYQGVYGRTYYKLYQPLMPYKDELRIRFKNDSVNLHLSSAIIEKLKSIKELHLNKTILDDKEYKESDEIIERIISFVKNDVNKIL